MPTAIPTPPRATIPDNRLADWFELCEFSVKLENITSTFSTGEYVLANLDANMLIKSIGYRCTVGFLNDSGEPVFPKFLLGSTDDADRFGVLTGAQLGDTNSYGEIPVMWQGDSDSLNLAVDIGYGTNGANINTGTLELWLNYRAHANQPALGGVRAK